MFSQTSSWMYYWERKKNTQKWNRSGVIITYLMCKIRKIKKEITTKTSLKSLSAYKHDIGIWKALLCTIITPFQYGVQYLTNNSKYWQTNQNSGKQTKILTNKTKTLCDLTHFLYCLHFQGQLIVYIFKVNWWYGIWMYKFMIFERN